MKKKFTCAFGEILIVIIGTALALSINISANDKNNETKKKFLDIKKA